MRNPSQIKDRIQLAIIEEINKQSQLIKEPENYIPKFIEDLTEKLTEITLDEITFRQRF